MEEQAVPPYQMSLLVGVSDESDEEDSWLSWDINWSPYVLRGRES